MFMILQASRLVITHDGTLTMFYEVGMIFHDGHCRYLTAICTIHVVQTLEGKQEKNKIKPHPFACLSKTTTKERWW